MTGRQAGEMASKQPWNGAMRSWASWDVEDRRGLGDKRGSLHRLALVETPTMSPGQEGGEVSLLLLKESKSWEGGHLGGNDHTKGIKVTYWSFVFTPRKQAQRRAVCPNSGAKLEPKLTQKFILSLASSCHIPDISGDLSF